ncbi:universal stress protein UspA [Dictyobacter sp. S3.2.2.5]|uniref:Universal stress protein UspA n=1 Tax=Dictyobacter halimunensis TaxID=3026934 RepID=A0ABQ6FYG6_9CHLR|nr:universal stress protein UspA [Dictyobacter sp. S3.2.2.5]
MFQHILVPLDGSQRAEQALILAQKLHSQLPLRLSLLSVIDPESRDLRLALSNVFDDLASAIEAEEKRITAYLTGVAQSYHLTDASVHCYIQHGGAVPTMLRAIEDLQCDLVVMCSHGRSERRTLHLGSVAQQLTRHCPVPLLVLKNGEAIPTSAYPDQRRPLHAIEIAVALDGTAESEQAILPAAQLVAAIAAPNRATVHLVHILPSQEKSIQAAIKQIRYTSEYERACHYVHQLENRLRTEDGANLNILTTSSVFPAADVPSALAYFAEQRYGKVTGGSDLLAMYSRGRPARDQETSTYMTEATLNTTDKPILII